MKKNPVRMVGFMLILLSVLLLLLVISGIFDGDEENMFIFSVLFLQMSMSFVYTAFKHQQKRIDMLEEQLNKQCLQENSRN